MNADLTGIEQFGLSLSAFRRLGDREVGVKVHLRAFEVTRAVVRRSADQRYAFLRAQAQRWLANLRSRFPGSQWTVTSQSRDIPIEVTGRIAAARVRDLGSQPGVRLIYVSQIPGHRRRPHQRRSLQWFCVRGCVAIQIEGETRGMQTVEDRFMLVRGASPRDAEERLRGQWRRYAEPYLNPHGQLVRWKLEAVTDVYQIAEEVLDPGGTEVYSKLGRRRLRPEFAWRYPRVV